MKRVILQMPNVPIWTGVPTGTLGTLGIILHTTDCLLPLTGTFCWYHSGAFNWSKTWEVCNG